MFALNQVAKPSVAIGCVRCSTEKQQIEGYSLTQQAKEIELYCQEQGYI